MPFPSLLGHITRPLALRATLRYGFIPAGSNSVHNIGRFYGQNQLSTFLIPLQPLLRGAAFDVFEVAVKGRFVGEADSFRYFVQP